MKAEILKFADKGGIGVHRLSLTFSRLHLMNFFGSTCQGCFKELLFDNLHTSERKNLELRGICQR